jgi:hypothetical protein
MVQYPTLLHCHLNYRNMVANMQCCLCREFFHPGFRIHGRKVTGSNILDPDS